MSLLQKAVETYDAHASLAGKVENAAYAGTDGKAVKAYQPLAPIGHAIRMADLEITIDGEGHFVTASKVNQLEAATVVPVTEESEGRAGKNAYEYPHPLCDKLSYYVNHQEYFLSQLEGWEKSEFSNPKLRPILDYIRGGTILEDLGRCFKSSDIKPNTFIRWKVIGLGEYSGNCWTDLALFHDFKNYYLHEIAKRTPGFCMISGTVTGIAEKHPGLIYGKTKLISANDTSNFTYRGRFTEDSQAATVGYEASQKAHNALRWLAAEQGTVYGGRTFLCWNPQGKEVYRADLPLLDGLGKPPVTPTDYRRELRHTLAGFRSTLPANDADVVIASFDAATTGRLALTYYRELRESDFLQRLCDWDESCWGWNPETKLYNAIQSPPLRQIVQCAFGILREEKGKDASSENLVAGSFGIPREEKRNARLVVDDRVMRQQIQRLLACRLERAAFPTDILRALIARASTPLAFKPKQTSTSWHFNGVYQGVLTTACAVIKKYYHDHGKGEIEMALERNKDDISYQFGRLLAVLEKVERDTYDREETREPNAIRLQSVYCKRPMHTANIIEAQLERAYFPRLKPGTRGFYKGLIAEILEHITEKDEAEWNKPLGDTYLVGYYLQRKELYTAREEKKEEN